MDIAPNITTNKRGSQGSINTTSLNIYLKHNAKQTTNIGPIKQRATPGNTDSQSGTVTAGTGRFGTRARLAPDDPNAETDER